MYLGQIFFILQRPPGYNDEHGECGFEKMGNEQMGEKLIV